MWAQQRYNKEITKTTDNRDNKTTKTEGYMKTNKKTKMKTKRQEENRGSRNPEEELENLLEPHHECVPEEHGT
jgi:hypothetical protein